MISMKENEKNLKKLTLIELKDLLERETVLLKNKTVIKHLRDKGASLKKFRDEVQEEISHRETVAGLENNMANLRLQETLINDKHTQKIFSIETSPANERFKPFSTLHKHFEPKPDSKVENLIEDAKFFDKHTKLLHLPESLTILTQQEERVKQEQIKNKFERELQKLQDAAEDVETTSEVESEDDD